MLHLYVYCRIIPFLIVLGAVMKTVMLGCALAIGVAVGLSACATPEVVQVDQVGDENLDCQQLKAAIDDANRFEREARHDRGVTGTNVAAAVFFWPALIGTYMNTDDALNAARSRQARLTAIYRDRKCA
jgi:hypothetical protein